MIHSSSISYCSGLKGSAAIVLVLDTPRHFFEVGGTPVLIGKKCFGCLHNIMQGGFNVMADWFTHFGEPQSIHPIRNRFCKKSINAVVSLVKMNQNSVLHGLKLA